jgi:hypothetical protein
MANVETTAENNLVKKDNMKRVRELDFTRRFEHNSLAKLLEVIGVTRRIPMMEGTTLYMYKTTGTLQRGAVNEGEIIPLSEYETEKTPVGTITLNKWRKAVTAEAIMKSGYDAAVRETDTAMLRDVQKGIRTSLFDFINGTITGSATAGGVDLQSALADGWGQLQIKFEDDAVEPVYFVNPLDVSAYLGAANITTQTAFGMNYIEDFLGLGTVVMSSNITKGTFVATAKENFIMYYLTMSGDIARTFNLTTGDLEYIGINSGYPTNNRMQAETLVANGITILVEYAEGVVKGTIGAYVKLDKKTATVAVGGTTTLTADKYPSSATVTWASSDSTKATVSNGTVTGVSAGTANITASITVDGKTYTDTCVVTVTAGA